MRVLLLFATLLLFTSPVSAQLVGTVSNGPGEKPLYGTCPQQLNTSVKAYNDLVYKNARMVSWGNSIKNLIYDYDRNCGGSNRTQACQIKWTVIQEKYHESL